MPNDIKDKIKQLLNYVKQENTTANDTIQLFKELFKDNYFESIDEKYYIKNSNGIFLKISHFNKEIDISLSSKFSNFSYYEYMLFIKSNKENIDIERIMYTLFDIDLSEEKLFLRADDRNIYRTISEDILNNNKFINIRYNVLKEQAKLKNSRQIEEEMIYSNYGGLDVKVIPVEDILYNFLEEFQEEEKFFKEAIIMLNREYPNFIKDKIDLYTRAVYIIENEDKYRTLLDCECKIDEYEDETIRVFWGEKRDSYKYENLLEDLKDKLQITTKDIENNKRKYEKLLEEGRLLSNKKYSIFDKLRKQKEVDQKRLGELGYILENDKEIFTDEGEISKYYSNIKKNKQLVKDMETVLEADNKIRELGLKYPFHNYTIDDEIEDLDSLNKLVERKDYYINKKEEFERINKIISENINKTLTSTEEIKEESNTTIKENENDEDLTNLLNEMKSEYAQYTIFNEDDYENFACLNENNDEDETI